MPHDDKQVSLTAPPDRAAPGTTAPGRQDVDTLLGLLGRKQHIEAEALARSLIARFPAHVLAWQALGVALKSQLRMTEALAVQQQAASLASDDPAVHFNLGNTCLALGRHAEAAENYLRALAIAPGHVEALVNCGHALAAQGRVADAVLRYRDALAIRPDFVDAHAGLAHALLASGELDAAEAHFLRALDARPDNARAHNGLGVVHRSQGRMAEAEACYRRSLALTPDAAGVHNNLGNALRDQGLVDQAESSYRRALELDDGMAEAHFNLGNVLREQALQADAERCYRRALAIDPHYLMALNNLGICLKKQGRLEEAAHCFESAIAIKPDFLQSHCNLAPFRTYAADDPHLRLFEQQQGQLPELPVAGRISYWFALGKMREDAGRHDDAFAAYAEGNRLQRERYPHDEAGETTFTQRLQSVFNADFMARRRPAEHGARIPIFIVGMPRSGTSLIEQILSSCPGVYGAGELTDLDDVLQSLPGLCGESEVHYPEAVGRLSTGALRQLGEAYLERVWRLAPDAERITDKLPANFQHVAMIKLVLPQAKIIHAMRDPMDSCFSCYARLFEGGNLDFSYDLGSVATYYGCYIRLMRHWQRVLPAGSMLDVHYEEMVVDTETQARRLLDYLELPWDDRCLDFHRNRRVVRTASLAQVRKPVYRSSVARWQNFEAHLGPLLDKLAPYR